MNLSAADSPKSAIMPPARNVVSIPTEHIKLFAADWVAEARVLSVRTLEMRRSITDKLIWFLEKRGYECCGRPELTDWVAHIINGHQDEGGRWGAAGGCNRQCNRPVSDKTVAAYYRWLNGFFNWLVDEEIIPSSPMRRVKCPPARPDQIVAPDRQTVLRLLHQALSDDNYPTALNGKGMMSLKQRRIFSARDAFIVTLFVDLGLRVSELCSLRLDSFSIDTLRTVTIRGKGNKNRTLPVGKHLRRRLRRYLNLFPRPMDGPLFVSLRGDGTGQRLTDSGVRQILGRLCERAGITPPITPHDLRRFYATDTLNSGAPGISVQAMMGHTTFTQTRKYATVVDANLRDMHAIYSPADALENDGETGASARSFARSRKAAREVE